MKLVKGRKPADFARAPLSQERIERIWHGVETREPSFEWRQRRKRGVLTVVIAACAAALVVLAVRRWSGPPADPVAHRAGSLLDGRQEEQLSLPDGTDVRLADAARARVVALSASEVRLRLERGSMTCAVEPRPERRFVVEARDIEVTVKGTEFTVSLAANGAAVTVSVARGMVEVRDRSRFIASLHAGQRWSSAHPVEEPVSAALPALAERAEAGSADGDARDPARTPSASPAPSAAPSAAPPQKAAEPGPHELFERGAQARLQGRAHDAAEAFDRMRRRYPQDSRSGHAAFQLGRIRLDTLGDARGAAEAFQFALAHPGPGFFLEDAQARLVEAWARAKNAGACRQARARYLALYPKGAHTSRVERHCDDL
ncbi:MAG TPA: FecR domain-containing protein [Polyangiaceae bacterium]